MTTIATFNIRYDNPGDGDWSWRYRKQALLDYITTSAWDIFGIQEALPHQKAALETLKEYGCSGVNRNGKRADEEYNLIFYKKAAYHVVEEGHFWLTPTPEVVSLYPGAGCRRVCVWAVLKEKASGKELLVSTTHLDNVSQEARIFGAQLIADRLAAVNPKHLPIVLMGDFNAPPEDALHQILRDHAFAEVKNMLAKSSKVTFSTDGIFAGASADEQEEIDFIYLKNAVVDQVEITHPRAQGRNLSDHFPVVATISYYV